MYNGKVVVFVSFLFFAILLATIVGRRFAHPVEKQKKINPSQFISPTIASISISSARVTTHPYVGYIPTPKEEHQLFYQLVRDEAENGNPPCDLLGFINGLKAVSAHIYLKYYAPNSPEMDSLRAAVRRGIKEALQESGLHIYPN